MVKKLENCPICGRKRGTDGNCSNEFCKKHNIQHFRSLVKYFRFDKSKLGTPSAESEFNCIRSTLHRLYWHEKMSTTQIAKMFNYKSSPTNIAQKFFKGYLNIPVKTVKYSVNENFSEGREALPIARSKYKCGWHTTWYGKQVWLRSSFERDYAMHLDEERVMYLVEALRIEYYDTSKEKTRVAIPDFWLPNTNTIVEVKSSWTLDKQNMDDKARAYKQQGYSVILICDYEEVAL